jgi:hypothetical protein
MGGNDWYWEALVEVLVWLKEKKLLGLERYNMAVPAETWPRNRTRRGKGETRWSLVSWKEEARFEIERTRRRWKCDFQEKMVNKPVLLHFMSTEILWQEGAAHVLEKKMQMTESMTGVKIREHYGKD